jgi:hypothetical protein
MTRDMEEVPATAVRQGDRLAYEHEGEVAAWTVQGVARMAVSEIKVTVNGLTLTYPGVDSVVLTLSMGTVYKTVEMSAAGTVFREVLR